MTVCWHVSIYLGVWHNGRKEKEMFEATAATEMKLMAKKVYLVFPGATSLIALLSINVALIVPENTALFSILCT